MSKSDADAGDLLGPDTQSWLSVSDDR